MFTATHKDFVFQRLRIKYVIIKKYPWLFIIIIEYAKKDYTCK